MRTFFDTALSRLTFSFLAFVIVAGCVSGSSNEGMEFGLISPQSVPLTNAGSYIDTAKQTENSDVMTLQNGENPFEQSFSNKTLVPSSTGEDKQVAQLYYLGPDGRYYIGSPSVYKSQNNASVNYNYGNPQPNIQPTAPQQPTYQQPTYRPKLRRDGLTRVAMLLPLTGKAKAVGQAFRNAALIAQFKIDYDDFVLQFYDTKGTAAGAQEAAEEAISHGVSLILGPLFSESVKAVKDIARAENINVVAFTTDPKAAGDNVFTLGLMLPQQIERLVTYSYEKGYQKFAVVAPDNELGKTVVEALQNITDYIGAETSEVEFYSPKAKDFTKVMERITDYKIRHKALEDKKALYEGQEDPQSIIMYEELKQLDTLGEPNFDAIIIPERGSKLRSLVSLLSYYDVTPDNVKFLGTALWNSKSASKEKLLRGGWFPAPPSEMHNDFIAEYKENFKETPPDIVSLAFDAVSLASVTAKSGNFSKRALTNESGFLGVDGIFRLLKDGTCERGLAIMEVTQNGSEAVSPAPEAFYYPPTQKSYADMYYKNREIDNPIDEDADSFMNAIAQDVKAQSDAMQPTYQGAQQPKIKSANQPEYYYQQGVQQQPEVNNNVKRQIAPQTQPDTVGYQPYQYKSIEQQALPNVEQVNPQPSAQTPRHDSYYNPKTDKKKSNSRYFRYKTEY